MRKFLVVVDMQNDFIDEALGTKEAQAIVPAVAEKIRMYSKNGDQVLVTMDTHYSNYMDTQEGKNLPVPHCIKGTHGWELNDDVRASLDHDAIVFEKGTFGSLRLADHLRNVSGEFEIEIVGLCTDICVVSNALLIKAALPEIKITVDANCCAGVTPEKHNAALETMKSCQINVAGE